MNAYLIAVEDRAGVLARLFDAAARRQVNVAPAYGLADGTRGLIALGSEDEAGLRAAIADAGYSATAIESTRSSAWPAQRPRARSDGRRRDGRRQSRPE